MAIQDAAVGRAVAAYPFVFLWNVDAQSAVGDGDCRIWNCPAGKKIVMAKVWIHSTDTSYFAFYKGNNAATDELSESLDETKVNKTSTVDTEKGHDDSEPHLRVAVGGSDGEDFVIKYNPANTTASLSVQLYVVDA